MRAHPSASATAEKSLGADQRLCHVDVSMATPLNPKQVSVKRMDRYEAICTLQINLDQMGPLP